ncbi:dTDP-4-dehydrorhamnose 3,5-epimerase family protein [uncultured Draconibacterium sp.]|uniref:dTDP-4-dehydrorhamnose 3,5-epimerase family protein n=1 Tax=uncultured Draconibacterium sp. TaxID=1573823 RepID=UPI002AA5EBF1|nr:dTDP-4-dehydrorhamnose 3,5-epimerase family protein [uncultured Draconibacterium sp.]
MTFTETPLDGAFVAHLSPYKDNRGIFERIYCKEEFKAIGINQEFVQMNYAVNKSRLTFRGFHYQNIPHCETKLVTCVSGRIIDTIIDIRKDSPTFLQSFSIELSDQEPQSVIVPEGFAHGYITLEDNSCIFYLHTTYYEAGAQGGLNYKDPLLNIKLIDTPKIISEHDQNFPFLDSGFEGLDISYMKLKGSR